MERTSWVITEPGDTSPKRTSAAKMKCQYIPKQQIKEGLSEGQKKGVEQWNLMVSVLRANDLMEDKQ